MRQRCFDDSEGRIDICFHRRVELVGRNIQDGIMRLLTTCVRHQNVEAAEALHVSDAQYRR